MQTLLMRSPISMIVAAATVWIGELLVFGQATPHSSHPGFGSLDQLTQLGAIGMILAFVLWQQTLRDRRIAEEIREREQRMRQEADDLRQFIMSKLLEVVEKNSNNIQSRDKWRDEAGISIEQIKQKGRE